MNILALDTCTECCSAALLYQGKVYEQVVMTQRGHSDLILGMMDTLFEQAACSVAEVEAIAFGRGPGSFTGVRVGVGVAQGIAFARELPVIAISSLAAVAQGAADVLDFDNIAVANDARMGEVYSACYRREKGTVKLVGAEQVCPPNKFIASEKGKWAGVGTAWGVYQDILQQNFSDNLSQMSVEHYPTANNIIKLAQVEVEAGRLLSAEQAIPVYLRDDVAKKKGEQKRA